MHRRGPVRCTAPVAGQRPQHWSGHRDQRRAKPQCLGGVETVFHTTGCDQPGVRAGGPDSTERIYRRQPPVEERLEKGGVLAARRLDTCPVRAAQPGDIDSMDPGIKQALRNIGPDSGADLLYHHRHLQRGDKGLDGVQNTTPVRLALGLDRLLKRVQMD